MNYLRPDEIAVESQIEKKKKEDTFLKNTAKTAIGIGASAFGIGAASKIFPFLSEHIPLDLAIKGISKVSPEIGKFLKKGRDTGLDIKEGFDFIKNKINNTSEETKPSKQNLNIIEQESPELFQFIDQEIKKGRKPIEAGALAQNDKRFTDAIKKLSKNHKTSWSNILQSIFGSGEQAQPQQSSTQQQPASAPSQQQQTQAQISNPTPGETTAQFARRGGMGYADAAEIMSKQQQKTQGSAAKQQLVQAMQALSNKLKT